MPQTLILTAVKQKKVMFESSKGFYQFDLCAVYLLFDLFCLLSVLMDLEEPCLLLADLKLTPVERSAEDRHFNATASTFRSCLKDNINFPLFYY